MLSTVLSIIIASLLTFAAVLGVLFFLIASAFPKDVGAEWRAADAERAKLSLFQRLKKIRKVVAAHVVMAILAWVAVFC